jgi:glycosyltransferase involved in cell wall biosynthesis
MSVWNPVPEKSPASAAARRCAQSAASTVAVAPVSVVPDKRTGIIALVPDNWHGIWMPRHHVLSRLAQYFEVVWMEPALGWRDYWLLRTPAAEKIQQRTASGFGLHLYSPGRWLPEVYSPRRLGSWIRSERLRRARRFLADRGCEKIILYLWRPQFEWALDAIPVDLTCYHIDDEYTFSPTELPADPKEIRLLERVDQVIIHSRRLHEKKGRYNKNTLRVPNGVEFSSYSARTDVPADIGSIPRPRIGYVGVVKSQLDIDLLMRLALRNAGWSFVMVGPQGFLGDKKELLERFAALPNVYFLGNRLLDEIPAYMQAMDVCTMCYEVCDYTDFIHPLKLNEYLATGCPIVSSPIDSVLPLRDMLHIARDEAEWTAALGLAISDPDTPGPATIRQAEAARHDWGILVERIASQFRTRLQSATTGCISANQ